MSLHANGASGPYEEVCEGKEGVPFAQMNC